MPTTVPNTHGRTANVRTFAPLAMMTRDGIFR
jgi:hypothetical protein